MNFNNQTNRKNSKHFHYKHLKIHKNTFLRQNDI